MVPETGTCNANRAAVWRVSRQPHGKSGSFCDTQMRVIQLGKYYPPVWGGIETVTWDLVEGLNRSGIVCDVLVAGRTRWGKTEIYSTPDRSYRVTRAACPLVIGSTAISPSYVAAFRSMCSGYDLAVLHLPNPLACLALYLSGFRGNVGLVWHSDVVRQRVLLRAFRSLQTWTIRRADFVIGATPAHIDESDCTSLFRGKAYVVPFGLDEARIGVNSPVATASVRSEISVLAVGRLVYYKGFDVLIRSFANLDARYRLTIVGDGPLKRRLGAIARSLGLNDRIDLVGRVSNEGLRRSFADCDVFCLPSVERSEMYGMAQIEAMAFGKPLVVTRIPRSGTRYIVKDGITGLTVPAKDPVALANAISTLGESQTMRERYGRAARRVFERLYTADLMVKRHIELYRAALHASNKR